MNLTDSAHWRYPFRCEYQFRICDKDADQQDFPTITFNKYESIEMPFRMFRFPQLGPS